MRAKTKKLEWAGSAIYSPDERHRYWLTREWNASLPVVNFVGLNPSSATAEVNDPTVRRCIGFAQQWGFGGLIMTNLFAWRATDPAHMRASADPVGPDNDTYLHRAAREAQLVVLCWGEGGRHLGRTQKVRLVFDVPVTCLGVTKSGQPRHPLYLASKTGLESFIWPAA
jgi:hypothetical protein